MSASTSSAPTQEFLLRVPKNAKKRYNVMRFHGALNIDVTKWSQVRMERENNMKDFKADEEMPKFGAGSEFGREQREEARRKKYGIMMKKYNPEDQPWLLRTGGKAGKKFRGIREGGIAENASYYVFVKAQDGAFEAYPIDEWYNFTPVQRYKTLNAEEAEEEFGRRDKVLNYFSIMFRKRLKNDDDGDSKEEKEEKKKEKKNGKPTKYGRGNSDFKISDMDDWINSSDADSEEDDEAEDASKDAKKQKGNPKDQKNKKKKKKKKKGSDDDDDDDEPLEDSDDGDDEGREVDYMSDESSSEDEFPGEKVKDDLKGVEDEEAIRKMEESGSEEENEEEKKETEETKEEASTSTPAKQNKDKKDSKKAASSSESSSDTSDSDDFDNDSNFHSAMFMQQKSKKNKNDGGSNRSNTPTQVDGKKESKSEKSQKRLHAAAASGESTSSSPPGKKAKLQQAPQAHSPSLHPRSFADSNEGISEEAVRRYLMRKPMTTTELLHKFKSKKTGLSREHMVNTIAQILKRLNPDKKMVKDKMYLSIKPA